MKTKRPKPKPKTAPRPAPEPVVPVDAAGTPTPKMIALAARNNVNWIGSLQEAAVACGVMVPAYVPGKHDGPDHAPVFLVECRLMGMVSAGEGKTVKAARQGAARNWIYDFLK